MNFLSLSEENEYINKPKSGFAYIYSLSDPNTNEIKYIGYTKFCLKKRFREHIYEVTIRGKVNKKSNWVRSLLKEGKFPNVNIVDTVPFAEWGFWERYYICLYRSWGFILKNDAEGGRTNQGYRHSEETKLRIKKSNLGKKRPEGTFKHMWVQVTQIDLSGKIIKTFSSITSAEKETNISDKTINRSCQNKNITAGGYSWCYPHEIIERVYHLLRADIGKSGSKYVAKYDTAGKLLFVYDSMTTAANEVNIPVANISRVCMGGRKTAKGFIWKNSNKFAYDKFHKN